MQQKFEQNFRFLDNCMSICSLKLSLRTGKYLASAVNVLTNSHNILHITKSDFFKPNILIPYQRL